MADYCPITGDSKCKCNPKLTSTTLGNAMMMDIKAVLRKIFTDHSNYTSWLIIESLPVNNPGSSFVATRLLRNPSDIANILKPIIGDENADIIEEIFTEHLKLAAATLEPVRTHNDKATKAAVEKFYANGDQLGEALSSLNPNKLSPVYGKKIVREHNQYVVKLVTLRGQEKYQEYIDTFDIYYKHMLMFSDTIYESLTF